MQKGDKVKSSQYPHVECLELIEHARHRSKHWIVKTPEGFEFIQPEGNLTLI